MPQSEEQLQNLRHSLAHLLAAAVMKLWPDTKRTIGPAIDDGFYFDFEFGKPITERDLPKIEKQMRKMLPTWDKFERHELDADQAKKEYPGNEYKHELIDEFAKEGQKVSFYKSGDYWDLCRGGHVASMKEIDPGGFKLDRLAGAYWRGDEKNTMLTRIYGLAFPSKIDLDAYLVMREEAKKRDHKILGPKLDLFTFSDLVGAGLPLFTPKGTMVRDVLNEFVWELRKARGYESVDIPHIAKKDLYEKSGHWSKFSNELFRITTREGHIFAMKPMNCPHHIQIFARKQWSFRELPQRYASTTKIYRDEQTGELSGLSRVRSITQDDAHVFCRQNQVQKEISKIWDIIDEFYKPLGFELEVHLSRRDPNQPEKYLGTNHQWQGSENALKTEMLSRKVWREENDKIGEAAFYGPKIDFLAKDSLHRQWQLATIQLDFNQPERFNLTFVNQKGEKERIVMIHAAIMGSIERFMSILIEHYAGAFPIWLAPVQVAVLPISEKVTSYSKKIYEALLTKDVRVELDDRNESIGKKIRDAEMQKLPYMLVLGEKEQAANTVNVRKRGERDQHSQSIDEFLIELKAAIASKKTS